MHGFLDVLGGLFGGGGDSGDDDDDDYVPLPSLPSRQPRVGAGQDDGLASMIGVAGAFPEVFFFILTTQQVVPACAMLKFSRQ